MSDNSNQGATENSPNSNAQQMIPKERLDEVIAQREEVRRQNELMAAMLRQQVPARQAPAQESDDMKRLREENPGLYAQMVRQAQENKRLSATQFQLLDKTDSMEFVQEFGEEGKKMLPMVNAKLEDLRQRGIHHWNRGQIFLHLKGVETLEKARTPAQQAQAPAPTQKPTQSFPSQDPSAGAPITPSAAAPSGTNQETLSDLEKRLENEQF